MLWFRGASSLATESFYRRLKLKWCKGRPDLAFISMFVCRQAENYEESPMPFSGLMLIRSHKVRHRYTDRRDVTRHVA
jgi:hypothetical protein